MVSSVVGNKWGKRRGRLVREACVKGAGSTRGRHMILRDSSNGEGTGILSVAVKCVDIERNTRGEGGFLDIN